MKNLFFAFLLVMGSTVPGWSLSQELQLGYVYDFWDSNFIYHGEESRIPVSYKIAGENFAFKASTAFMMGSYVQNGTGYTGSVAFNASDLSDTSLRGTFGIPMGGGLKSIVELGLNIASGNRDWEAQEASAAVPEIFVPSYYHGRGWGGDIFYVLGSSEPGFQWSAGVGYLRSTTSYNSGVLGAEALSPWGGLVGMVGFGVPVGPSDDLSFRAVRSFPIEASAGWTIYPFTLGQSMELSGQWASKLGRDRLQVTASFATYDRGYFTDPKTYVYSEEPETYFGKRLEVRPFLGWVLSPGVNMETGLDWKHIFANQYPYLNPLYQAGGDLAGIQQSITFQVDTSTFWNVAGQYQYVYNKDAAYSNLLTYSDVSYNRVSLGTNVGWKW